MRKAQIAAILSVIILGVMTLSSSSILPASGNPNSGIDVCEDLDTGHLSGGTDNTYIYTAPTGMLVDFYCVKAGSINQDEENGPVIVEIEPNLATVIIDHPTKDSISHFSVRLIKDSTEPTPTPTPTVTPTISPTPPIVIDNPKEDLLAETGAELNGIIIILIALGLISTGTWLMVTKPARGKSPKHKS